MDNQVILRDTDITSYIGETSIFEEEKSQNIREMIQSLGGSEGKNSLPFETLPLLKLRSSLAMVEYRSINLDFLSMGNCLTLSRSIMANNSIYGHSTYNKKTFNIQVPRFGVFPFYKSNFFQIDFSSTLPHDENLLGVSFNNDLPKDIIHHLLRAMGLKTDTYANPSYPEFARFDEREEDALRNLLLMQYTNQEKKPEDIMEFLRNFHCLRLKNEFNGIIPKETKNKAKNSLDIFKKDELYMVTEIKPEEWNVVERIINPVCPLLLGIVYNKSFIIDHFNTTPLEEVIRREFLE